MVDTSASNHMLESKNLFMDIDESIMEKVTFGDSSHILVKGVAP